MYSMEDLRRILVACERVGGLWLQNVIAIELTEFLRRTKG